MKYIHYTKELLEPIVKESVSWRHVCEKLKRVPAGGTQVLLKKNSIKYGIDFSHFKGQAHRRGTTFKKIPLQDYLDNKRFAKSHDLKLKLIKTGLRKKECEICGLSEWRGEEIALELDHINSNHNDNSLDNLQIVCPNCHAMETRKRRKNKRDCCNAAMPVLETGAK